MVWSMLVGTKQSLDVFWLFCSRFFGFSGPPRPPQNGRHVFCCWFPIIAPTKRGYQLQQKTSAPVRVSSEAGVPSRSTCGTPTACGSTCCGPRFPFDSMLANLEPPTPIPENVSWYPSLLGLKGKGTNTFFWWRGA